MKRITRKPLLTPREAAAQEAVRSKVMKEFRVKTPAKRVLLDQWHMDVYVPITRQLTEEERNILRILMDANLKVAAATIVDKLESRVEIEVSQ